MEFSFYNIVAIIATIFLILLLTVVGLSFQKSKPVDFPPSKNTCPDYWIADYTNPEKVKCKVNALNMGTIPKDSVGNYLMTTDPEETKKAYTPGYDKDTLSVDFADPAWLSSFAASGSCAIKKWANKYEISWDGVANFNNCK